MKKILSILLILLGITHDVATFTRLIMGGLESVDGAKRLALMYMSLMCGTSLILCGILMLILLPHIKENKTIKKASNVTALYLLLAGILAVVFMPHNPFAWATLVVCAAMTVLAFKK